jgi:hypothetical protein
MPRYDRYVLQKHTGGYMVWLIGDGAMTLDMWAYWRTKLRPDYPIRPTCPGRVDGVLTYPVRRYAVDTSASSAVDRYGH